MQTIFSQYRLTILIIHSYKVCFKQKIHSELNSDTFSLNQFADGFTESDIKYKWASNYAVAVSDNVLVENLYLEKMDQNECTQAVTTG